MLLGISPELIFLFLFVPVAFLVAGCKKGQFCVSLPRLRSFNPNFSEGTCHFESLEMEVPFQEQGIQVGPEVQSLTHS